MASSSNMEGKKVYNQIPAPLKASDVELMKIIERELEEALKTEGPIWKNNVNPLFRDFYQQLADDTLTALTGVKEMLKGYETENQEKKLEERTEEKNE